MIEDFDSEYLKGDVLREENKGDDIVDEVEEEDALRMIDEEIMNTAVAKQDARKLRDLISKIDGTRDGDNGKKSTESLGSSSGSFKL